MKSMHVFESFRELAIFLKEIKYQRIYFVYILILQFLTTVVEGVGVTALIPVLELLYTAGNPDTVAEQSKILQLLSQVYAWFGFSVNLPSVISLLMISVIFRQILKAATVVVYMIAQEKLKRKVRETGFVRILSSELEYFERENAGSITNDLITEADRSVGVVFRSVTTVGTIILLSVYAVLLFFISKLAIVALLVLAVLAGLVLKGILKRSFEIGKNITVGNGALSAFLVERIRSIRLVKLAGTETREKDAFFKITSGLASNLVSLSKLRAMVPLFLEPIGFFIVMGYMVVSTTYLDMSFEASIVVLGMMGRLLPVVQELSAASQGIVGGAASLRAVNGRLQQLKAHREVDEGDSEFVTLNTAIDVKNVSYSYTSTSEKTALQGITFSIRAGEFLAVVGPSGAGKSTLIELLSGLRKPTQGSIEIDGHDISSFTRTSLRDAFAFVPQSPHVLDRTIGDHIKYGNHTASPADVQRAAELSGAMSFIQELPDGFGTWLGEGGAGLSGGQRQRIDIARAILKASPILILDEPTAGLDIDSVYELQNALHRICSELGTTIILISHNLATAASADTIVVLQQGACVAVGTHEALLHQPGWYSKAHKKQMESISMPGETPQQSNLGN